MPELLSTCHSELKNIIEAAAGNEDRDELQAGSRSLQSSFERLCGKCEADLGGKANLRLAVVENVSFADAARFLGASAGFTAGDWPPVFLSVQKSD